MEKGRIQIKGQTLRVVSLIKEDFSYRAGDRTNRTVSVCLKNNGESFVRIDGSDYSPYIKEAKESAQYKITLSILQKRLYSAYQKVSDSYLHFFSDVPSIISKEEIEAKYEDVASQHFECPIFKLPTPSKQDIEKDLRYEAEADSNIDETEIDNYIKDNVESALLYRKLKWAEVNAFHNEVYGHIASQMNQIYKQESEKQRSIMRNILEGPSHYVTQEILGFEKKIKLPFTTTVEFCYSDSKGLLEIGIVVPVKIPVPDRKAIIEKSGAVKITPLPREEISSNETLSILASSFSIAWHLWNISTNIKNIRITTWNTNHKGLCWFDFERGYFAKLSPKTINILEESKNVNHLYKMKDFALIPIEKDIFENSISKGFYSDDIIFEEKELYQDQSLENTLPPDKRPVFKSKMAFNSLYDEDYILELYPIFFENVPFHAHMDFDIFRNKLRLDSEEAFRLFRFLKDIGVYKYNTYSDDYDMDVKSKYDLRQKYRNYIIRQKVTQIPLSNGKSLQRVYLEAIIKRLFKFKFISEDSIQFELSNIGDSKMVSRELFEILRRLKIIDVKGNNLNPYMPSNAIVDEIIKKLIYS